MTLLNDRIGFPIVVEDEFVEVEVCRLDDLVPDRGVCALVAGAPVAVFRCAPRDELYAVANHDPFSGASVLSRGIVGSIGGRPVVASPLYKNRFDLRTGTSLDDPSVRIRVYTVRLAGGRVLVNTALRTAVID
jgi:nitrite reductase (NADH) small subunit